MEKTKNKIEELEKNPSKLEYICKHKKYVRFEDIAELCEVLSFYYKPIDNIKSIEYLTKSYNYYVQVYDYYGFNKNKLIGLVILLAEQLESVNHILSIYHYKNIIEYYAEKGDIVNVIKYYEIIARLYFDNFELELSKHISEKIILIAGNNKEFNINILNASELINKINASTQLTKIN